MRMILAGAAALAAVASPAAAQNNYDGFRAEVRLGYETPTISIDGDDNVYELGNAVSYGGEVGFDFAVSPTVTLGAYGSLEESGVELSDPSVAETLEIGANRQLGGRVGIGLGSVLGYFKLGYSDMKLTIRDGAFTLSDRKGGYAAGIGVEGNLGKNAYWGLEINGSDFGEVDGVSLNRSQAALRLGFRI